MRLLTQPLPERFGRQRLLTLGVLIVAALAAYEVSEYIISGNQISLLLVAGVLAGGAVVVAVLTNWRRGLYFFFIWLLVEDLARKYLGNNMGVFFAKDILVGLAYFSFFLAYRRKEINLQVFRPPFRWALLLLVWFAAIQMFNPASTSIFYGLLGIKIYFYYVPLMVLAYAFMDSELALRRFFFLNVGLILVLASLGIVQAIVGPTFLNPEVLGQDIRALSSLYRAAPISGVVVYRPNATFVSAGRFSNFLIVSWLVILGFTGYLLLRNRRGRLMAFVGLAITAAGCLLCASRGVFMWCAGSSIVGAAAFVWGAPWRQGEVRRVLRTLVRVVLGITLAVVLLLATYPEALMNRLAVYSETLDPRSPATELVHRMWDYPVKALLLAFTYDRWPYGYGLGSVSLGVQYVTRFFNVSPPAWGVESGFGCIIIEMGIVGLALWFVMGAALLVSAWKVVRQLKGSPWFPLGFIIFWYAFLLLIPFTFQGLQAYQDFLLNSYVWFLLGVLFRLPKIALSEQFSPGAPVMPLASGWTP
jgi:hypothetical protein